MFWISSWIQVRAPENCPGVELSAGECWKSNSNVHGNVTCKCRYVDHAGLRVGWTWNPDVKPKTEHLNYNEMDKRWRKPKRKGTKRQRVRNNNNNNNNKKLRHSLEIADSTQTCSRLKERFIASCCRRIFTNVLQCLSSQLPPCDTLLP